MKKDGYVVVFVVRGGARYGMGHFVRSLSLGEKLSRALGPETGILTIANSSAKGTVVFRSAGRDVRFVDFEADGDLGAFRDLWEGIASDITVIDHLDVSDEEKDIVSARSGRVILFDDLEQSDPEREICRTVVQCQHFDRDGFGPAVEGNGVLYLRGPGYFVLPGGFDEYFGKERDRSLPVASIFVSIGGSNYRGAIFRIIQEIREVYDGAVTVAGGFDPSELAALRDSVEEEKTHVLTENTLFPEALYRSDLAVIAGGFTKYEAAALGVPSLILGLEGHQEDLSRRFESFGCGVWLGMYGPSALDEMKNEIRRLCSDRAARIRMSRSGRALMPGNGADEIVRIMTEPMPSGGLRE